MQLGELLGALSLATALAAGMPVGELCLMAPPGEPSPGLAKRLFDAIDDDAVVN